MFRCMNYTFNMNSSYLKFIVSFQNNQTPLHYASECGHNDAVLVLISHGATVDMKDKVSSKESVK